MALASKGKLLADRYRVAGRLGAGGMAVVVLADDERLGRKVAVKRLHAESPDEAALRFEREAKLGASLNHPNIVAVYDIVSDDEGVLIVMEYVDGRTLRLEMDSGPMPPARAIEVLSGVAAALDHAHEHGVVHRDVKPANVLIADRDGSVKLTDLGIATAAERTHITRSGVVLGTAAYMAPERLDGEAGDAAVDVYAMAAVAFEMLSGRKAVTGRTAVEIARRVMEAPPPDLAEVLPGAPRRAAEVLKRGLAKDPADRPASAGELVRELSAAYAEAAMERPPAARPRDPAAVVARVAKTAERRDPPVLPPRLDPGAPAQRRPWRAVAALAVVAAAVLAAVLLAASGGGGGGSSTTAGRASTQPAVRKPHARSAPKPAAPAAPSAPPASGSKPAPPQAAPAGTPAQTLTDFYTRAANHDFQGAWALGTGNLHGQFGSIDSFRATLATLRSISFPSMSVSSQSGGRATVVFSSIAQHTDHLDRCTGQASILQQGSTWLVDHIDVNCVTDGAPGGKKAKRKPPKAKQKPPKH